MSRRIVCQLCKKELDHGKRFSLGEIPLCSYHSSGDPLNLIYIECHSCGLVQSDRLFSDNELYGTSYNYRSDFNSRYKRQCMDLAVALKNQIGLKVGDKIYEVGSNDGALQDQFKTHNLKVVGIEPNKKAAEIAKRKGHTTINHTFDCNLVLLHHLEQSANVLIANNVVSHVNNLHDFFTAIDSIVLIDGIVVFQLMNYLEIAETNKFENFYHGVNNLILPEQIASYFYNFEPIKFEYPDLGSGFSGICLRKISIRDTKKENNLNRTSASLIDTLAINLHKWLELIETNYATEGIDTSNTAGYCANSKIATILALSKSASENINVVVDKNPEKHGKYITGSKCVVISLKELDIKNVNKIILMNDNLIKEVTLELKDASFRGIIYDPMGNILGRL